MKLRLSDKLIREISARKKAKKREKWMSKQTASKPTFEITEKTRSDIKVLVEFLKMPLSDMEPVFAKFESLPGAITKGTGDNKFVYVPGKRENRVLLVAHADTVWDGMQQFSRTSLRYDKGVFSSGTPGCGIGADDRAGCAMLWLMKDSGHSLLVTGGEESGGIASSYIVEELPEIHGDLNKSHAFVVQLDRRGSDDYKCYYVGSKEFRKYVEDTIGYQEPNRGSFTDIGYLCDDVCGVNLSIGYYNEHTDREHLVVAEWLKTLTHVRSWLSNPNLPRCVQDEEEKKARSKSIHYLLKQGNGSFNFGDYDWDSYVSKRTKEKEKEKKATTFYDEWVRDGSARLRIGFKSRKEAEEFFAEYELSDFSDVTDREIFRRTMQDYGMADAGSSDRERYQAWLKSNTAAYDTKSSTGYSILDRDDEEDVEAWWEQFRVKSDPVRDDYSWPNKAKGEHPNMAGIRRLEADFKTVEEAMAFFREYSADDFTGQDRTRYWNLHNTWREIEAEVSRLDSLDEKGLKNELPRYYSYSRRPANHMGLSAYDLPFVKKLLLKLQKFTLTPQEMTMFSALKDWWKENKASSETLESLNVSTVSTTAVPEITKANVSKFNWSKMSLERRMAALRAFARMYRRGSLDLSKRTRIFNSIENLLSLVEREGIPTTLSNREYEEAEEAFEVLEKAIETTNKSQPKTFDDMTEQEKVGKMITYGLLLKNGWLEKSSPNFIKQVEAFIRHVAAKGIRSLATNTEAYEAYVKVKKWLDTRNISLG